MDANTVISFPVSSYMLGIMIAMFITIFALKNLTIRKRYVLMSALFIVGSVLTILSSDMLILIIARFVAGFGFGGVLLSTSSLVIAYTSNRTRSQDSVQMPPPLLLLRLHPSLSVVSFPASSDIMQASSCRLCLHRSSSCSRFSASRTRIL